MVLDDVKMEKQEVRAVIMYFYVKWTDSTRDFYWYKGDIWGSLLLHIWQLQSGMVNLNVEDHHVKTRTTVDDH